MIEALFDVNDEKLRSDFFLNILPEAVNDLDKNAIPLWGQMTAQHIIEHLTFTFKISTGKIKVECKTPVQLLPRAKRFLFENTETPHNFKNPLLSENPPALQYKNLEEARDAMLRELKTFLEYFKKELGEVHTHPIFGPSGKEEWHRALYKHCYHHLLQFAVIKQTKKAANQL